VEHAQWQIDIAYDDLVSLYATTGDWTQGEAAYAALQASPDEDVKTDSFTFIELARLRWGQGQDPMSLLAEALRRASAERFLKSEREAQRLAGEIAFAPGDLARAEGAWQAAYTIAQREGIPLGSYLADLARLHAAQRDGEQAKALLAEALALGGHAVSLAAVEVYTALGEHAEAKRYVDAAYREAWADGPPYAFYHELQRIRAALKTLGTPEPQLPPFDLSRVQPLPDEAEIRAFIENLKRKQEEAAEEDEDAEDGLPDDPLALPSGVDSGAPVQQQRQGKHPWWKFWSQN
jgi:hypothetical protein